MSPLVVIREVASAPRCDLGGEPARAARRSRTLGHLRSQNSNTSSIELRDFQGQRRVASTVDETGV